MDVYPLAQLGRDGPALLMSTVASFVGSTLSLLVLACFAPLLAVFALQFGSPEYFSLLAFGLVASAAVSSSSSLTSLGMVLIGILFGLVGMDVNTGMLRFNFGLLQLADGINLVIVAMGIFGVAEVGQSLSKPGA